MSEALLQNSTNVRSGSRARPWGRPIVSLALLRLRLAVASALAPRKAVDIAARLFATPPRHSHTAPELELLSAGKRFEVIAGMTRLSAWRFGREDRPVVLLSHGWGGRGAQLRAFVPALVESGYQAVLFDQEGHGLSEGHESSLVHFIDGLDAVARHLEAQGARIAAVIGHSLGAAAAGAWLNQTERALRVVLVAPPTSVERWSGYFARRLGIREPVRRAMQERIERRLGRRWQEFELPNSVARVRAQALVIHDAEDREVAASAGIALARAWPGARFAGTRGLGHRAILRDAAVVQDAVDFIADRVVFAPPPASGERLAFGAPSPLI